MEEMKGEVQSLKKDALSRRQAIGGGVDAVL